MAQTPDVKKYDKKFLIGLLEQMALIRRFEEKAAQQYGLRKIGGFCHIYIGQEAVATGAVSAVDLAKDYVLTAYRDHGHALAVGMDPKSVMAELYGKKTGCSRAKGGSMHMFDASKNFLGGNGIVGAHIPVSTGVGLKIKYREEDGVVLCFFGDGAIHQGSFHESLNMAGVWKLPVVYICENNQYGMGTDYRRVSAEPDLWKLAGSYKMPGTFADGMNALDVHEKVKTAVERARSDSQPSLIEARTYRYMGHSMSDPAKYRTKEELMEQKEQDPIIILQKQMNEADMLTDDEYKEIDDKAKETVKEAIDFAENSEEPEIDSLYEDVLA
ncbi:Acetoin:2,6-dichlorophenolindophenol oxidoreductase subunit alpha [Anaerohalosphaera lusitana]|uniref:Pyruvate dehydrogenase E1 component subunit alpha n=1 Tax=Anaerohalosphaera lusitana TaxID=1936003 RepID=A0A1U9NPE7_9BACT|nr:pyruvate dehydrogenase (acetyl-transferring) E1 component subunit alpha [Anaerohalosphaera lusitana]AQT69614.1 Acetoin:2,6-dichlorophenolindophenol oxidoreductase subunit alpha [Anaerohalosphaera lusitana]